MRSHFEILPPGSIILIRLFFTACLHHALQAHQSPFLSSRRFSLFPLKCQSLLTMFHEGQQCVLSVSCSFIITAVLGEVSLCCRSLERPVNSVRTFQHPCLKAGLFSVLSLYWNSICSLLFRTLPYCLEAAHFKADGNCPMRSEGTFYCMEQTLAKLNTNQAATYHR